MEIEIDPGTGSPVRLQADQFVQDLQVETTTGSSFNCSITLFDDRDRLEDLLLVAGIGREVKLRWNWASIGLSKAPQLVGSILRYTPTFMPQGIQFVLEVTATAVLPCILSKVVRAYSSGQRISDIVFALATERGWSTVDHRGRQTIEPTGTVVDHPFNSTDESDMKFINDHLKDQAVNVAGQGGYLFYFDAFGAVHFHTRTFLSAYSKSYVFGRGADGEVLSFTPTDSSALAFLEGGGNVKFRSLSSLDATQTSISGTTSGGVNDDPEVVEESATAVADLGDDTHAVINLMARDADELSRLAKARRERANDFHVVAEVQVVGTHDVDLLDYADVSYLMRSGAPHFLSGRYSVKRIVHSVNSSGWITTFGGTRYGFNASQAGTVPRQNITTVSPETTT